MTERAGRGDAWPNDETVLLIELWGDERVQEELERTPRRNIAIFKRIWEDIKDRIPDDCRSRIKRLKTLFYQAKRQNNKSGGKRSNFPYYERLDQILGRRPAVNPVNLTDSLDSTDEGIQEGDDTINEGPEGGDERTDTNNDTETESDANSSTTTENPGPSRTPSTSRPNTPIQQSRKGSAKGKSLKRKEKVDTTELLKQFREMEEMSEKRFYEIEEKRLKMEKELEEKRHSEERAREENQRQADRQFFFKFNDDADAIYEVFSAIFH